MIVDRESGAVVHHVQASGKSAGAPLSRPANYSEFPNSWVGVPLSDIPAGGYKVRGSVSSYSSNAATVTTQGGGVTSKGCAPSLLAQGQAGRPGGSQSPSILRGVPALVGGLG